MVNYSIPKTNSIINDVNDVKNKTYQIWLANQYGELLIKKNDLHTSKVDVSMVTIEGKTLEDCIYQANKLWKILFDKEDLRLIYSFKSSSKYSDIAVEGFLLKVSVDESDVDIINEHNTSLFINYTDLEESFTHEKKELDFNESFFSLLSAMQSIYSE